MGYMGGADCRDESRELAHFENMKAQYEFIPISFKQYSSQC